MMQGVNSGDPTEEEWKRLASVLARAIAQAVPPNGYNVELTLYPVTLANGWQDSIEIYIKYKAIGSAFCLYTYRQIAEILHGEIMKLLHEDWTALPEDGFTAPHSLRENTYPPDNDASAHDRIEMMNELQAFGLPADLVARISAAVVTQRVP
jgi:hypothetical protein